MQHNSNSSGKSEDACGHQKSDESNGFYTTLLKIGDRIFVGTVLISIIKIKEKGVILSIQAPKETKIVKKTQD